MRCRQGLAVATTGDRFAGCSTARHDLHGQGRKLGWLPREWHEAPLRAVERQGAVLGLYHHRNRGGGRDIETSIKWVRTAAIDSKVPLDGGFVRGDVAAAHYSGPTAAQAQESRRGKPIFSPMRVSCCTAFSLPELPMMARRLATLASDINIASVSWRAPSLTRTDIMGLCQRCSSSCEGEVETLSFASPVLPQSL